MSDRTVTVTTPQGLAAHYVVRRDGPRVTVTTENALPFAVRLAGADAVQSVGGAVELTWPSS